MKQGYQKYHSDIKLSFSLGVENHMLPKSFLKQIPNSTSHYWKYEHPDKYLGSEFSQNIQNSIDDTKLFLDNRLYISRKAFIHFARIYITLISLTDKNKLNQLIKQHKEQFITLLEHLPEHFPFHKYTILRFLQVSKKQYDTWVHDQKFKCTTSMIGQCFKRRPYQISQSELQTLKRYMNNQRYKFWCIRSIWGKAVRDNAISMAESTWYRYCKKLGFSAKRKIQKKPRLKGSFDAPRPNHTWHMDISEYKTIDNIKFYIYTVVDNYSRKIVAHDISRNKSAKLRTQNLKKAILNEFKINLQHQQLDLIVDGGSENNNTTIHQFIKNCEVDIDKKIALKDVKFSNSIIEGTYHIMKSYYFRKKVIYASTIEQELDYFVNDYNNEKPCFKHRIYTPNEVHLNPKLSNVKIVTKRSNQKRLEENRNYCCKIAE